MDTTFVYTAIPTLELESLRAQSFFAVDSNLRTFAKLQMHEPVPYMDGTSTPTVVRVFTTVPPAEPAIRTTPVELMEAFPEPSYSYEWKGDNLSIMCSMVQAGRVRYKSKSWLDDHGIWK